MSISINTEISGHTNEKYHSKTCDHTTMHSKPTDQKHTVGEWSLLSINRNCWKYDAFGRKNPFSPFEEHCMPIKQKLQVSLSMRHTNSLSCIKG